jgi:hypothetical protein
LVSIVQERGGVAVEETLADNSARLQRAQDFNQQRDAFQRSRDGLDAAREAYSRVVGDLKGRTKLLDSLGCRIQDVYGGITMLVGKGVVLTGNGVALTGQGIVLIVEYKFHANSLETALEATFYDGIPRLSGLLVFDDPRTLKTWRFTFGLLGPGRTAWVGPDGKEHATEALAEFLLRHFMEVQQRQLG